MQPPLGLAGSIETTVILMFAALIFGCIAIYMIVGWIVIGILDRRIAQRRGGSLWIAMLFWPITVVVDLIVRGGPNRP